MCTYTQECRFHFCRSQYCCIPGTLGWTIIWGVLRTFRYVTASLTSTHEVSAVPHPSAAQNGCTDCTWRGGTSSLITGTCLPMQFSLVTLGTSFPDRPMAQVGSVPRPVPPYLAVEPIEGHRGVRGPQHAHGGRGHVREHRLVPPPPLVFLRPLERVAALRPPWRLRDGTPGPARALPCPKASQSPLRASEPIPPRPKNPLCVHHRPARPPGLAPAPAIQSNEPPSRTPEPSHNPPERTPACQGR